MIDKLIYIVSRSESRYDFQFVLENPLRQITGHACVEHSVTRVGHDVDRVQSPAHTAGLLRYARNDVSKNVPSSSPAAL